MAAIKSFDVVVIGGGSGLTAAYYAERDGKSVALVDSQPDALGGTCVSRGCIPTKGLIQSADVMRTVRDAAQFGIDLDQSSVRVDFGRIMSAMRASRAERAAGTRSWVDDAMSPYYSRASFVAEKVLELEDGTRIRGDKMFIATGARPAVPPITGLDAVEYWTNETVLEQQSQPESLLILGGGYVGCEFGHFFSSIGTEVTLVDREGCLLREDEDVRELFTSEFGKRVRLVLEADVSRAARVDGRIVLTASVAGAEQEFGADALLVATGRRPNTDGLGLDRTGVDTDDDGWIRVDGRLRTAHPDIYAYGDVTGRAMFKHTSSYEGELAYANATGADRTVSYAANPHAVFSDPQIGAVGLTERDCAEQGLRYKAVRKTYEDIAKGQIIGSPPGFAKLLVEQDTDRILGFHMIGPNAADLIHEVVVAMSTGAGTAEAIRNAIHVHPTLPELIRQVFDDGA